MSCFLEEGWSWGAAGEAIALLAAMLSEGWSGGRAGGGGGGGGGGIEICCGEGWRCWGRAGGCSGGGGGGGTGGEACGAALAAGARICFRSAAAALFAALRACWSGVSCFLEEGWSWGAAGEAIALLAAMLSEGWSGGRAGGGGGGGGGGIEICCGEGWRCWCRAGEACAVTTVLTLLAAMLSEEVQRRRVMLMAMVNQ